MPEQNFGDLYSSAYNRPRATFAKDAAMRESVALKAGADAQLGHPDFEHLKLGETQEAQGVVFFLDIRGFTKLSFVLPKEELLWILQALTEAAVRSVLQFGGHVMEFTGDGIMAVFGDSQTRAEAAAVAALRTTAFLMKGIQDYVNPGLERYGTEQIRTAVGMEFGDLLWSRIGLLNRTQVKPLSEATFLAGKLSTGARTKAWEAMVGGSLAEWIPEDLKVPARKFEFVSEGTDYSRDLFLFKWEQFAKASPLQMGEFRSRLLGRKLEPGILKSPYFAALKTLTEAGYSVVFDESADCPHLVVDLDKTRDLAIILTFVSRATNSLPSIFVRQGKHIEQVEIDLSQWKQGRADLTAIMKAVGKAWLSQ